MDDPRCQQFFVEPQLTPQRHYEAIRAVVIEGQPLQDVAARFGFAYGTLRNVVAQFHACIRQVQRRRAPRNATADNEDVGLDKIVQGIGLVIGK